MNRDTLIVAFAKLQAAGRDARTDLLAAAASLPRRQYAAVKKEIEAVAELFASTCPAPKTIEQRPEPEPRNGRLSNRALTAWRRYAKDYQDRLAAHMRAL